MLPLVRAAPLLAGSSVSSGRTKLVVCWRGGAGGAAGKPMWRRKEEEERWARVAEMEVVVLVKALLR